MRPTARRQSALRAPLNDILATEANVRLLRALAEAGAPASPAELARRTRLQRSTVSCALRTLGATGIVETVGTGAPLLVTLREAHPLAPALQRLFAAEGTGVDRLISGIWAAVGQLARPPLAAWIEGPAATGEDAPGDIVTLRVVTDAATLPATLEALHAALEALERDLDVGIEVRGATRADLDALPAAERARMGTALPVVGLPPAALTDELPPARRGARASASSESPRTTAGTEVRSPMQPQVRTHADHDARALALGAAVAERLARDSSIVARARRQIARRMREASPGEQRELAEWDRLLRARSTAQLRRLLVDPGERATRLRQTLPFLGVLTPAEREAALASAGGTSPPGRGDRRTAAKRAPKKRSAVGRRTTRRRRTIERSGE